MGSHCCQCNNARSVREMLEQLFVTAGTRIETMGNAKPSSDAFGEEANNFKYHIIFSSSRRSYIESVNQFQILNEPSIVISNRIYGLVEW